MPRDAVHDSYISAPYILSKLKACKGLVQAMSYWTYTNLFEEPGPPPSSFHGGIRHLDPGAIYSLKLYRTGYHSNDAYSTYLEIGAPKDLTPSQVDHLNKLTCDRPEKDQMMRAEKDGTAEIAVPMRSNDIVLILLQHRTQNES